MARNVLTLYRHRCASRITCKDRQSKPTSYAHATSFSASSASTACISQQRPSASPVHNSPAPKSRHNAPTPTPAGRKCYTQSFTPIESDSYCLPLFFTCYCAHTISQLLPSRWECDITFARPPNRTPTATAFTAPSTPESDPNATSATSSPFRLLYRLQRRVVDVYSGKWACG